MSFDFLAIVFVFGLLVLIHELGHFLAAKMMGVRVERFSVGFPPRLFGKKIGDTDYCISAIPLGGYVKMSGMIDESLDDQLSGEDHEFSSKPVWKRIVIITAGVVMNFFLAVLILTVVNYSNGEIVYPSTEIGHVGQNGIEKKIGFEIGDRILSIAGKQVSSWNEVEKQLIENLGGEIDFTVLRGTEQVNLLYKKEWFSEKNSELIDIRWMPSSKVGNVIGNSPADKSGLKKGDEIRQINGQVVNNWADMTKVIRKFPEKLITIDYLRDGRTYSVELTPDKYEETDSLGNAIAIGKIGVEVYYDRFDIGLFRAVSNGFRGTIALIKLNMKGLWWVISGTKSASDVIGGPIMIAKMAQDAVAVGWERLWYLIAALSAVLAFFNILPIPALDGGHLVFLIVEGIIGKPVPIRIKILVQQIGMAILLTLIVFIIYIDIRRLLF